jgi:hypothetical protein
VKKYLHMSFEVEFSSIKFVLYVNQIDMDQSTNTM